MGPTNVNISSAVAAAGRSKLPWWKDGGLRKLLFWLSWILAAQMLSGYDQVVTSAFQSMEPWLNGWSRHALCFLRVVVFEHMLTFYPPAMDNPTASMLGLITASLYMGGLVGSLFAAVPSDRFGRRVVLQAGLFLEVVGSVLQAAAPSRGVFIAGRVVVGAGMSFTTVAGPSLLAELCPPHLRGKIAPTVSPCVDPLGIRVHPSLAG